MGKARWMHLRLVCTAERSRDTNIKIMRTVVSDVGTRQSVNRADKDKTVNLSSACRSADEERHACTKT